MLRVNSVWILVAKDGAVLSEILRYKFSSISWLFPLQALTRVLWVPTMFSSSVYTETVALLA